MQSADFAKAKAVITREVMRQLQEMLSELESIDNVFDVIGLKGTATDKNLRTAAIAINAAMVMA